MRRDRVSERTDSQATTGANRRTFIKAAGAVSAVGLAGCLGGSGAEEGTIRYSGVSGAELNDLLAMFHQSEYMPENVLENLGDGYEFEFIDQQATPGVIRSLGGGEADAGLIAYSSMANAIAEDVVPSGLTVIAPLTYDGPRYADVYATTPDSDIESVDDLAGSTFGVNGVGSAIDIAARVHLTENDIDPDDLSFQEVSFGAMPSTLTEGQIDTGTFIQPFFQTEQDNLKPVFNTRDVFGSFLKIFVVVRDEFLENNESTVESMLDDFWQGVQWWQDDGNSEQRLDIAEQVVGLPRGLLEALVQTDQGYYHGEDGLRIDSETIQVPIDGMQQVGFLEQDINIADYVDNSYLPDAADTEPDL
jgi:ABC-type nitrate/sulfonate/bicarbonate transport system substrate-binding protein